MPGMSLSLKGKKELQKRLLAAVRSRVMASKGSSQRSTFVNKWAEAERRAVGYIPERAADAIRRAERTGGKPQYTTIQIPYSMAVLMTSHTYWTTVFLARSPVIQLAGNHGEGEQQVLAQEALMNYQTQTGKHIVNYHTWLYDLGKYGHGVIGAYWDIEEHYVSEIVEQEAPSFAGVSVGKPKRVKHTRKVPGYEGNKLFNIRPVDFFHDPRVTLANMQDGEYCGYITQIGWNRLVEGHKSGKYVNLKELRDKKGGQTQAREQTSEVVDIPDVNAFGSAHVDGGLAGNRVEVYEMYIELIPRDWQLGSSDRPEKWVITVTSDFTLVLGAQPLGAYHNKFPFAVMEMEPEGYSMYNRGIPEITEPIQDTLDWLVNSHFYNVRKTMNNEFVVDPSRVEMMDLKNPLPGNLIRLKPAAYGSDTRTVMSQLETRDVTKNHMNDLGSMMGLGERITGVNDQIMGVANQSSRRSATEVRSSNTFSVNRLKTVAEYGSAMGFGPLASMMVQNTQQYYTGEKKFRLTGNAGIMAGAKFINVTPEEIAGSYMFLPVDGTLPVDKFAQANLWRGLMGEMRQIPQLAAQYDISKIFAFVAQLAGLKNIDQFRIEVVPDGSLDSQVMAGNVLPMGGAPAGGSLQLEGMGDTG
ncbi:MAG: hypothetical protein L3J79_01365 [Candidatus Marinimicrobia bacterium]|nr:hypothetical protein [Candidatus Neomarinimicrobiota bacterium]